MKQTRTRFKSAVLVDNVYSSPVEVWLAAARRKIFFWSLLLAAGVIITLKILL